MLKSQKMKAKLQEQRAVAYLKQMAKEFGGVNRLVRRLKKG